MTMVFIREINDGEVESLTEESRGVSTPVLEKLRHKHHLLAMYLAEGRPEGECAKLAGYSISRVSILKNDPAFRELVSMYHGVKVDAFEEAQKKLAMVGMQALEEISERLEESPGEISYGDLLKTVATTFDRSIAPSRSANSLANGASGAAVAQVVVNFVESANAHKDVVIENGAE